VASGVSGPVSIRQADVLGDKTFYLGVDGTPGHVASDLDVIRPEELGACDDGLRDEQSVLLIGPSGCGKSVLLWRAARDLVPAARVLRVKRLLDPDDAASLTRHVRLLSPTETSPVLVVVDDLGRPERAAWSQAASALRELPHVRLLGAARSEDFSPALLVGATRVVEPRLSAEVARLLSDRIEKEGITPRMATEEAFERSEGLLMEFVALLSTGRRLRQVDPARSPVEHTCPNRLRVVEEDFLGGGRHQRRLHVGRVGVDG
jgi:energy-coupling factor transporter ATP-binding protein EcfA2